MGYPAGGHCFAGQRGQALVFSLLFLGVVLLGLVFLYKAGRLTSEKMALQNAADAAAFSVSVVEARDLNFAAYTNRAMVANEVAIGQLVGLVSWANHIQSFSPFLRLYANAFNAIPVVGNAIAAMLNGVAAGFNVLGQAAQKVTNAVARVGVPVLYNINRAYSISQLAFHTASIALSVGTVYEMVRRNAPGAKVSDFGFVSLVGHVYSYHREFLRQNNMPSFFAAVVRKGRDPFSTQRGWSLPLIPHWKYQAGFEFMDHDIFKIWIELGLSLDRWGGTELRFTEGTPEAGNFGWSAADTTGLNLIAGGGIHFLIGGGSLRIGEGQIRLRACIDLLVWEGCPIKFTGPFPTSAPFSAGYAQTGVPGTNAQSAASMGLWNLGGPVELDDYGRSPLNNTAWYFPGMGVMSQVPTQNVSKSYKGLPRYLDNDPDEPAYGFEAPYLLLGLVKEMGAVNRDLVPSAGRFELKDKAPDDEIGVLTKSEVYFARPNDLWYFRRSDGLTEIGNTFNPFWQARLVDTSNNERLAAMAIQQKEPWQDDAFKALADFNQFIHDTFGI